jgi:hypothetical protein
MATSDDTVSMHTIPTTINEQDTRQLISNAVIPWHTKLENKKYDLKAQCRSFQALRTSMDDAEMTMDYSFLPLQCETTSSFTMRDIDTIETVETAVDYIAEVKQHIAVVEIDILIQRRMTTFMRQMISNNQSILNGNAMLEEQQQQHHQQQHQPQYPYHIPPYPQSSTHHNHHQYTTPSQFQPDFNHPAVVVDCCCCCCQPRNFSS